MAQGSEEHMEEEELLTSRPAYLWFPRQRCRHHPAPTTAQQGCTMGWQTQLCCFIHSRGKE